ncbi:hypothetical protein CCP3SC1AL1_4200001 [Gammaproteobacteria bacterium]
MQWNGTFMNENKNSHIVCIEQDVHLVLYRLSSSISRIFFINDNKDEISIPNRFHIQDNTNGLPVRNYINSYFLCWTDNYDFFFNNELILTLNNYRNLDIEVVKVHIPPVDTI